MANTPIRYHSGPFPPQHIDLAKLVPYIGEASRALGRYDGVLSRVPNPNILISPMTRREAEKSSRIEGTQATLKDVMEFEAGARGGDQIRDNDIGEVINYQLALNVAKERLNELPLSQRLIRNTHEILMQGARGQHSSPGNYRSTQNWIGSQNCSIEDARYIPCSVNELQQCLHSWESYLNSTQPDPLIQLALIHAEFEAIHPFLDGNGRIGRLIVPLFLFAKEQINSPSFYISEALEANRQQYYDRLQAVSANDDWQGWCEFFLEMIKLQSERNILRATNLLDFHEEKKDWIVEAASSKYGVRALDFIMTRSIFNSSQFKKGVEIPNQTANTILTKLCDEGLLTVIWEASGSRPAVYACYEILKIID